LTLDEYLFCRQLVCVDYDKIVEEKLMCQSVYIKPLCLMASGCSNRNSILQICWLNFGN